MARPNRQCPVCLFCDPRRGCWLSMHQRINSSYLISKRLFLTGVLSSESDICRSRCPTLGAYLHMSCESPCNRCTLQAARDVRSSEEALIDIFEHIGNFLRRLEIYTEVPPTVEMMDMMVKIMVEILSILGIATKEIKQSRTSE